MQTIALPSGTVAFAERGDGRPLLLMHANPGDHRDYDAVIAELAATHRVIALDWPGYGGSPPPVGAASAMLFAELAIELTDALSLCDAVVVGNSVGGYAGVRLALARPEVVGALVLIDSGGFTTHNAVTRAFCRVKGKEWFTHLIATRFAKRYLRVRNEHTRAILARTEEGRRIRSRVAVDAAIWRSFLDPDHDLRDAARRVRTPTLVVWGKHDPVLPLESDGRCAASAIEGAELVVFDTGHMPFAEDPATFVAVLRGFLARAAGQRGTA